MIKQIFKIIGIFTAFFMIVGASFYLTITYLIKNEDTIILPNLVGKDIVYVLKLLSDFGLNTKVKGTEFSITVPENRVLFQEPEPGSEIKKGRDVRVVISAGPKKVLVPNLRGLPIHKARFILEENDLCQGELSFVYNNAFEKDYIVSQTPMQGQEKTKGTCIDLLVSMGPMKRSFIMPSLDTLSLEEAVLLIEDCNLSIGEIKWESRKNSPQNIIVGQTPLSGYFVTEGKKIDIIVNRMAGKPRQGYPFSNAISGFFRHRLDPGFLKRHVLIQLNVQGFFYDLYDDFAKPGEEIWLIIPTFHSGTLLLYEDEELIKMQIIDTLK